MAVWDCKSPREVGQYVKELRLQGGKDKHFGRPMSQHDLSIASGVGKDYISRIENGRWKRIGGQIWESLASALHTTTSDILSCGRQITSNGDDVLVIPIAGAVPCGQPSLVFEGGGEMLYVASQGLPVSHSPNLYAVVASGDSLIGDGILNGDYLIVDRNAPFIDGGIHIACVEGDCCARHVYRKGDKMMLISSTDMMEVDAGKVELQGRVIASNRMTLF